MIKLRELLNVTEQAPQPPQSAPVPAQSQPTSAPTPQEPTPAPTPDTAPTPEDPSEYDFTRDFRAFEDTKNKAEAAAKKKLLDKMNKMMLGKKVVANASRGYGQPKTDYTIESVKKVSVEFWYKDWVVIVSDENDKKFFLTPGINIKIETGGAAVEPGAEPTPGEPQADQAPAEPPKQPEAPTPEPEAPAPEPEAGGQPPAPESPAQPAEQPPAQEPQPATPEQPNVLAKKKKKVVSPTPVAEEQETVTEPDELEGLTQKLTPDDAQQVVGPYFSQFFGGGSQRFDVRPFVKKALSAEGDQYGGWRVYYELHVPTQLLGNFDQHDFKLEVRDSERRSGGPGQPFSHGYVDIQTIGRFYVFKFTMNGGLDI